MNLFDTPIAHINVNARKERLNRQNEQARRNADARRKIEQRADQRALDAFERLLDELKI